MGLQDEIAGKRAETKIDQYAISVGEWMSIYEAGEVEIHPEFQRYFRWSLEQKTRLIESLLLGIPIPPIYVAQRGDGVWDVIDGVQRLSTLFQFTGILRDERGALTEPLTLEGTKHLPSLVGMRWDNPYDPAHSFPHAQKLLLKRAKLDVVIVLAESDPRSKFELFQRLNTGGSSLTDQEMRNSILVSLNPEMHRWMRELCQDEGFRATISITERASIERYDMELVLRFILFRTFPLSELSASAIGDIGEFLTDRMVILANNRSFDYALEGRAFRHTFALLAEAAGENAFRKYDRQRGRFSGSFLVMPFEVVALGLGHHFEKWSRADIPQIDALIRDLWSSRDVTEFSGSGVRASTRLMHTLAAGRRLFAR